MGETRRFGDWTTSVPFGGSVYDIGAFLFVLGMSLVKEPIRKTLNAVLVAGACGMYLSGGFGLWQLLYPVLATPVVYRGLRSYRFIGLAWLMHAAWDLVITCGVSGASTPSRRLRTTTLETPPRRRNAFSCSSAQI